MHRRKAPLFPCKTVVRRTSCGLQRAADISVTRAQAPLWWLCLGRQRISQACHARAPCCAGHGRTTHYVTALHERKASLIRCETVVRRASCGFQHAPGFHVARAFAILSWLSLGRWQNTRACRARAPCYACHGRLMHLRGYCTGGRPLALSAGPWCDVRAVTSSAQPDFAWHANRRHCAGCLSGGGETRKLAACAPCCAGCDRPACYRVALHRREASLSPCKTVVRRASYDLQHAAGFHVTDAQAPLRRVCLGRWQNTQACRARAPCCAGCDRLTLHGRVLHRRKAPLFRRMTVVRRASCGLQHRTAGIRVACEQAPLRWLSLGT